MTETNNVITLNEVVDDMRMRTVMSMLAGAGIGAAAVGMMRTNKSNGRMGLKKMANDFLKSETEQER